MNIREFILGTLLPYKLDKSICAVEFNDCRYLTSDGRKCAVGKWLKKGEWQDSTESVGWLIAWYGERKIFKRKALNMNIDRMGWLLLQKYHDAVAASKTDMLKKYVEMIEEHFKVSLPELKY